MNLYILNRNEEVVAILSDSADNSACHFLNSKLTTEINKGSMLNFEISGIESEMVKHIREEQYVVVHDGDVFRMFVIKEISDLHENDFVKLVYCEEASIELYDEVLTEEPLDKVEMGVALADLLKQTRWTIGEVDNCYTSELNPEYKLKSVLDGIYTLAKQYGAEVDFTVEFAGNKIVGRKVHMKKNFGRNLGKRLEYNKDINSIKRIVNTGDIKTAVIPFGKVNDETGEALTIQTIKWEQPQNPLNKPLGQTFLEDVESTKMWGYKGEDGIKRPRWIAITFDQCESKEELINYAYIELNKINKPKISYEVQAMDLYKFIEDEDYSFETVKLGDIVTIIDHDFNPILTLSSRILKIEMDLSNPANSTITLGTISESIVDKDLKTQIEELNTKIGVISKNINLDDVYERIEEVNVKAGTGRWEQIQEVNQLLFGTNVGYHYMSSDQGIWVFDRPVSDKPTKAVAIKGGMVGIAKYDEQLQRWNVGTFIDGDSVNASMITTGFLKGDRIEGGTIMAESLSVALRTKINEIDGKASTGFVESAISTAIDKINLSVSQSYTTKQEAQTVKEEAISSANATATNLSNVAKSEAIKTASDKATELSTAAKNEAINLANSNTSSQVNATKNELNEKIEGIEVGGRNLVYKDLISGHNITPVIEDYKYTLTANNAGSGLNISSSILEVGKKYVFSYKAKKLSGTLLKFGGHISHSYKFYLDGNLGGSYSSGVEFPNDTDVHTIRVEFTTLESENKNLYIQPIRGGESTPYSMEIWDIQVEEGTKGSTWKPAIEDVEKQFDELYRHITERESDITSKYQAAIEISKEGIMNSVEQQYTTTSETGRLEESLNSLISQTAKDIEFNFNESKKYTVEVEGKLQEFIEDVGTYIRFDSDGIELGEVGNTLMAKLGNTKLAFLQNGFEVAYISNNKMYITDSEIKNRLTLGHEARGFFDFIPRDNGNLSLKWRNK